MKGSSCDDARATVSHLSKGKWQRYNASVWAQTEDGFQFWLVVFPDGHWGKMKARFFAFIIRILKGRCCHQENNK